MKYNELQVAANKSTKRVGRGIAAGQGKTAGRGTKGQKSRTGSSRRPGFEGGQNPLMQRLPKMGGFRSIRIKAENIYTSQLEELKGTTVDNVSLAEAGITSSPYVRVKLIGNDAVSKKLTVKLQGASAAATEAVKKAGGSVEIIPQIGRPVVREAKNDKKNIK
jgi:large subunit ribosomal protein L15